MKRIAEPLEAMGAGVQTTDGGLPLWIDGAALRADSTTSCPSRAPRSSRASCSRASSQDGPTTVVEPVATRDHTERMLRAAGARTSAPKPGAVEIWPAGRLDPLRLDRSRRLLLGRAVRRRRHAAARARACASPGSASTRRARASSTCSSGWARGSRSTTARPRPASRSPTSRSSTPTSSRPRSSRPRCRA